MNLPLTQQNANVSNHLYKVYKLSQIVKYFACFDILFSFLFIVTSPYLLFYSLLTLFIGILGYYGAKYFKVTETLYYLVFQILKTGLNIGIPIYYFIIYPPDMISVIFYVILSCSELYLTYVVYTFFKNLSKLNPNEIDTLLYHINQF